MRAPTPAMNYCLKPTAVITFVIFSLLTIVTSCERCVASDAPPDLPVAVYFDQLDESPITDYHKYTQLVLQYVSQMKRLEAEKSPTIEKSTLLKQMIEERNLKRLARLIKAHIDIYRDDPDTQRTAPAADVEALNGALTALKSRLAKMDPTQLSNTTPPVQNPAGTTEKPKAAAKEQQKDLIGCVEQINSLLKEKKYSEVARNHLDYMGVVQRENLEKVLPQIEAKLKGEVQSGCCDMLDQTSKGGEFWMLSPDDAIVVVRHLKPGFVELHRDKDHWLCRSITMGHLDELKRFGISTDEK